MPMICDYPISRGPITRAIESTTDQKLYIVTINPENPNAESGYCPQEIQSWLSAHFKQVAVQSISKDEVRELIEMSDPMLPWPFSTPLGTLYWVGLSEDQIQQLRDAKPEINGEEVFVLALSTGLPTVPVDSQPTPQASNASNTYVYLIGAEQASPHHHPSEVPRPILEWLATNAPDVRIADCPLEELPVPAYTPAMKELSEDWAVFSSLPGPVFQLHLSQEQAKHSFWHDDDNEDGLYFTTFSFYSSKNYTDPRLDALRKVIGTTAGERLATYSPKGKGCLLVPVRPL